PETRFCQLVATSLPSGVTAPMPVITTRRRPFSAPVPAKPAPSLSVGSVEPTPMTLTPSSHSQSAVDEQHRAGHERGLVGAEEAYRPGDVLRRSEPAQRGVGEDRLLHLPGQYLRQRGLDVPGRDGIRA